MKTEMKHSMAEGIEGQANRVTFWDSIQNPVQGKMQTARHTSSASASIWAQWGSTDIGKENSANDEIFF